MIALMHGASLAETTAFVAVVELKSFTKAAKQLALSPPRVREMVRLERACCAFLTFDLQERPDDVRLTIAAPEAAREAAEAIFHQFTTERHAPP